MFSQRPENASSPWHAGEKTLQQRVGVAERMEAFGRRVIRDHLPEQHRDFYRQLPFILLGSVDAEGNPWASILEGLPGFAHAPEPHLLQL
ncbi:MAG: FAD-binding oxidoreductase, partial [Pseudomonas sp.]|nr:FAD-binding oxidoreductase [Pseudomonas sp.]